MAAPAEGSIQVDNVTQLLTNALIDSGVVGIDEAVEQPILNRAFTQANWLLAQWARKRWLFATLRNLHVTGYSCAIMAPAKRQATCARCKNILVFA